MTLFCSTCGAENGTRTRDPNLGKVVLYQLSYFRVFFEDLAFLASPRPKSQLFGSRLAQKFRFLQGISLNASAKVMLFFELTNFSAVFFQKNLFFSHFRPPPLPYTLFIYKKMPTTGLANSTSPATSSTSCWVSSMSASKRLTSCTIYPNWNSTNRLYKPTLEIRMKSTDSNLGFKYANYELFCKHLTIWDL